MQESEADRVFGRPQKRKAQVKGDADLDKLVCDESDDESEQELEILEKSESGSELEPDETARMETLLSDAVKAAERKNHELAQSLRDEALPESE